MEKTVLCFGDSNTWGYIPATGGRYDESTRWPRRLARTLGEGFYVVEEGLNGRTTAFEDPIEGGRNGRKALEGCLMTHSPVDLFVVMLGTNDTKKFLNLTPYMIARGLESIIMEAKQPQYGRDGRPPAILVVSPVRILAEGLAEHDREYFDDTSVAKADSLCGWYGQIARQYECGFMNAADFAKPSLEDGIHMDPEGHALLADAMARRIREMLAGR